MREWIGPVLAGPAKHLLRLARDPEYRIYCGLDAALGGKARLHECRARVHNLNLEIPDAASFLASYKEIFVDRTLDFPWPGEDPRILDLGANIGLSVLAFKRAHPRARITALEPDPSLFEILKRNVHGNGFTDVTLIPKAAWHEAARLPFVPDGADGGKTVARSTESTAAMRALEVEALSLPDLLRDQSFDYVKMDIEGAERAVLPACAGLLGKTSFIVVEYHGGTGGSSALASVLGPLEAAGFQIQVHTVRSPRHPFLEQGRGGDYDLILHIYGSRR